MSKIRIWTPESPNDIEVVECIANKIVDYYGSDIQILTSTKKAYNQAVQSNRETGLENAVEQYLKQDESVIFLLDSDGVQSQAQRRKEPNSLINTVQKVVNRFRDRVHLVLIKPELEAWLLVDILGICHYYTDKRNQNVSKNKDWSKFVQKNKIGDTENIVEAISGGRGAKECLQDLSKKIWKEMNPNIKQKKLNQSKYNEKEAPAIAKYIEINKETLGRNQSLQEFADFLK